MRAYVLYYVPRGAIAEDTEILGVYSSRGAAETAYDTELDRLGCADHELRIDCFTVED